MDVKLSEIAMWVLIFVNMCLELTFAYPSVQLFDINNIVPYISLKLA